MGVQRKSIPTYLGKELHWEVQGEIFRGSSIEVESWKTRMDSRERWKKTFEAEENT